MESSQWFPSPLVMGSFQDVLLFVAGRRQSRSHSSCSTMSNSGWRPDGATIGALCFVNSLSPFLRSHSHFLELALRTCVTLCYTGLCRLLTATQVSLPEMPFPTSPADEFPLKCQPCVPFLDPPVCSHAVLYESSPRPRWCVGGCVIQVSIKAVGK